MGKVKIQKMEIDGRIYKQIRKDSTEGKPIWWKTKPELSKTELGSGLHVINGFETAHYDWYFGKHELKDWKDYEPNKIGGGVLTPNGLFVFPQKHILILDGSEIPKLISMKEYIKKKGYYNSFGDKLIFLN